jgi:predicted transposase YbfD/YdcC
MDHAASSLIAEHFGSLDDPRTGNALRHRLLDIMVIALAAVLCGADDWTDVELFGTCKEAWFRTFLDLPNGIPSHDTFGRVFSRLDPEQFRSCFLSWIRAVSTLTQGQVINIDGKTVCGSRDTSAGRAAIHMISAWAAANHLVLGQLKVDGKSNEITAIPELLHALAVDGCTVTVDAIGCQKDIAETIIAKGGDYVLALKDNQPALHDDVRVLFADVDTSGRGAFPHTTEETVEKGHGRLERRRCTVISDPTVVGALPAAAGWPELRAVIRVKATRQIEAESASSVRYYISSRAGSAAEMLPVIRGHWAIENSLHWVLDIAFREDERRMRKDNAAENAAILRHIALNLLKQDATVKVGIKGKRLKAGWDESYLLHLLSALF